MLLDFFEYIYTRLSELVRIRAGPNDQHDMYNDVDCQSLNKKIEIKIPQVEKALHHINFQIFLTV